MSDTKLQAAKELIQEKNYEAARSILKSMPDNVTAVRWLAQLDKRYPATPAPTPVVKAASHGLEWLTAIILVIAVLVIGAVGVSIYQGNVRHEEAAQKAADYINQQACTAVYQIYSTAWQNCVNDR